MDRFFYWFDGVKEPYRAGLFLIYIVSFCVGFQLLFAPPGSLLFIFGLVSTLILIAIAMARADFIGVHGKKFKITLIVLFVVCLLLFLSLHTL